MHGLVVASEEDDAVGVDGLQGQEVLYCLYRVVASVHVVPHKDEFVFGDAAGDFEEFQEVVELAVDVANDFDGCVAIDHIVLF